MKDIYEEIIRMLDSGIPAALATIVEVIGSSPRGTGAKFLVPKEGQTLGSVGGGCLEAEVWQGAMDSMEKGEKLLMRFKLDDESMVDSGLICGGTVTILVEPLQDAEGNQLEVYKGIKELRNSGKRGIVASIVLKDGKPVGVRGSKVLYEPGGNRWGFLSDGAALESAIRAWCSEHPLRGPKLQTFQQEGSGTVEILLEPVEPDPTLYIFGAGHIARELSPMGKMVNFKVVVIDDRPIFADPERFPDADQVLVEPFEGVIERLQINPNSYIVIVTRGHLYDGEVLEQAIKTDAGYIGMIGSRRKIAILYKGLREKGVEKERLDRVYAPIGLDIHSETPEEIAVSIIAELIKVRAENAREGIRL